MKNVWIAAATLFALSGSLPGDTILSYTGTFSSFPHIMGFTPSWIDAATPPTATGTPFWNNPSDDSGVGGSHMMNIGYILTGTGGVAGLPPVLGTETVASDFTAAGGADPSAFTFLRDRTDYDITLLFADSSLNTGNTAVGTVFGSYFGNTFTPIYNVGFATSPTGTRHFDPVTAGTSYGFYATVCYSLGVCETYTTGNGNWGNSGGGAGWNHFALFQTTNGNYAIGFTGQNGVFGEGLGDFNDVVVELQAVPEPGAIALMGCGLAGLGLIGRRRRSKAGKLMGHADPSRSRR